MQFTGIGKLISNLEEKTTLEDTDCLITGTSDAKKITWANVFSAISDGIKAKILEWTFTNLGTTDKTIIGAVNELNMKRSNVPSTLNALWTYGFRIMGYGIIVPIPTNGKLTITKGEIYDNTSKWYEMKYSTQVTVGGQINYIFQTTVDGATLDFGRAYLVRITGMIQ